MKFKALVAAPDQLAKLLGTLDRVSDSCVVHLTPELIQFAAAPQSSGKSGSSSDGLHVCADLDIRRYFHEFNVQSRAVDNRITFFVKIENLARALRSCTSDKKVDHVQMKLTKKQNMPVLAFEIHLDQALGVQVIHEVPIRIVSDPTEIAAYAEPQPTADSAPVAVIFPARDFKGLKNVVERMRSVNDWIRITTRSGGAAGADAAATAGPSGTQGVDGPSGDGSASLELLVSRPELVTIKTTYPRLGVPMAVPEEPEQPGSPTGHAGGAGGGEQRACALVEVRKLLKVLQSLSSSDLRIQNAIVCIVPGQMVILKVYLQDDSAQSFLIYYIPVGVEEEP